MGDNVLPNLGISSACGAIARFITHPIDTVKSRLQCSSASLSKLSLPQIFKSLYRSGGIPLFYGGLSASLLLSPPATGLYLISYDLSKQCFHSSGFSPRNSFVHLTSGIVAELASSVLWTPMEVIKQRVQITGISPLSVMKSIYVTKGLSGFWTGYLMSVGVFAPQSALFFALYENCKFILSSQNTHSNDFASYLLSSAFSAALSAGATNPLDVLKVRLQVSSKGEKILPIMLHLYRSQGVRGFFNGTGTRMLLTAPTTAITLSLYEIFKK